MEVRDIRVCGQFVFGVYRRRGEVLGVGGGVDAKI